jgi:hypothetical protein
VRSLVLCTCRGGKRSIVQRGIVVSCPPPNPWSLISSISRKFESVKQNRGAYSPSLPVLRPHVFPIRPHIVQPVATYISRRQCIVQTHFQDFHLTSKLPSIPFHVYSALRFSARV